MRKFINLLFSICFLLPTGNAQIDYTANDRVLPYTGDFGYGANMGYYPPWKDEQLAEIAIGVPERKIDGAGVTTIRPALFAHFLEQYGYDIRVPAFSYYQELGLRDVVAFIGYPSPVQREQKEYCPGHQSELFANMYSPIWDDGANGTPVNDENPYALYLYKMVSRYKDYIKIWEVWNEPDFDYSGKAWKPQHIPDNWWEADPDPCDYALRAPAFHYNRLLRISWEVIKSIDPEAYVAVGGLGFPSFMDVVLRHTDNPEDGSVSAAYPLSGGAYFDMMSFHSYPHIDGSLREWSDQVGGFVYYRHSDAAVEGMLKRKAEFAKVLTQYGYDGEKYPKKVYIITECNIPRKAFGDFIGSEEAQCNFLVKALVASQKNDIHQFHIYNMAEVRPYDEAQSEYDLMGLYQKLQDVAPYQQQITAAGITYRNTAKMLTGYRYDEARTNALQLPMLVDGAAFRNTAGDYRYVLWAITGTDQSEAAEASYSFPKAWGIDGFYQANWKSAAIHQGQLRKGATVQLSGSPSFIASSSEVQNLKKKEVGKFSFTCSPGQFTDTLYLNLELAQAETVSLSIVDHRGKIVAQYAQGEEWAAGKHQRRFAESVPNGLYICRLETKERTLYERVVKVAKGPK